MNWAIHNDKNGQPPTYKMTHYLIMCVCDVTVVDLGGGGVGMIDLPPRAEAFSRVLYANMWLGGVVVRALDLRLEIAGSIPAAAHQVRPCTSCSHTLSSASEVTTLWSYINQFKINKIK